MPVLLRLTFSQVPSQHSRNTRTEVDKHEINTGLSLIPVRFLRTIGSADAYIESRERLQLRLPSAAYLQRFFLHAVTSYSGNPNNTSDLINILPGRAVRPENQRLDYEAFDLYSLVSTGQPWKHNLPSHRFAGTIVVRQRLACEISQDFTFVFGPSCYQRTPSQCDPDRQLDARVRHADVTFLGKFCGRTSANKPYSAHRSRCVCSSPCWRHTYV